MASTAPTGLDAQARGPGAGAVKSVLALCARLSFAALLLSIALALLAGFGTRFGLWSYGIGMFGIFPFALYAGLAALAFGVAWMATALFAGSGPGALKALVGVVGAIAMLWVPLDDLFQANVANTIPPIHDISTDTEHPPPFLVTDRPGATNPASYDGAVRVRFAGQVLSTDTLQKLYYGEVRPVGRLQTTPAKLFRLALAAAKRLGWTIVATEPDSQGGLIQASDTSLLFGLTDDIIVRVRPAGIGARLDIRSKSRQGICDYGRNAERIIAFKKILGG